MIEKYDRDIGQRYVNIITTLWYFGYSELIEVFIYLKVYNAEIGLYDFRRMFWSLAILMMTLTTIALIALTCVAVLTKLL
jgi:hypothetical protein